MNGVFAFAQEQMNSEDVIARLQELYAENALLEDNSLRYNADSRMMDLSGHLIRVSEDTHVKAEKDKTFRPQKYRVVFSCQSNTFIIHKDHT
jgi:hypothetical protein